MSPSSSASGSISTDANGNPAAPGSGGNGQKTAETFTFTLSTSNATVGSIEIIYCTTPTPVFHSCTTPAGLDASRVASIVSFTGLSGTPTLDTTGSDPFNTEGACNGGGTLRTNCILLHWATPVAQSGTPTITLKFGGTATDYITNPTTANAAFYARVAVFSDTVYNAVVDSGSVANSTGTQINLTTKVQETLNFSISAVPSASGAGCTALTGTGAIKLGDANGVLDNSSAYDAHSYFRITTNAANGAAVYYSGDTLKGGANNITALTTAATASSPGTPQFGLGLDSGDSQSGNGYSFTNLSPSAPYDQANGALSLGTTKFAFDVTSMTSPVQLANSGGNPISCDTGSVRYLGNISTTTRPGAYKTTINYIAVPTF